MYKRQGQGLLISEWNTEESKPRKYYCITPEGKEVYEKLKKQWHKTAASMEQLLDGKGEEGICLLYTSMAAEGLRDAKNSIYGMRIFPVDIMTTLCNTINDYRM